MTGSRPAVVLTIGLLAMLLGGAAQAQEDLAAGKTPEQLFHSNCAMCHASPRGLAAGGDRAGGMLGGLESFLAQHYTAEPRSAAEIARYLKSFGQSAAPAPQPHSRQRNEATPSKPASGKAKTAGAKAAAQDQARREAPGAGLKKMD